MLWAQVRRKLGYSCSAGVAHNKLLAKLGCGLHKPNQQVRTLPLALSLFLVLFLFLSLCPSVSRPRVRALLLGAFRRPPLADWIECSFSARFSKHACGGRR